MHMHINRSIHIGMNFTRFSLCIQSLPELRSRALVSEVVQYPGDVLFIPHDWLHATVNMVDSVAISQEFCTFVNTDQRIQPLGLALYGGNDAMRGLGQANTYK